MLQLDYSYRVEFDNYYQPGVGYSTGLEAGVMVLFNVMEGPPRVWFIYEELLLFVY